MRWLLPLLLAACATSNEEAKREVMTLQAQPQRLLVAVDLATGAVRGLDLLADEKLCRTIAGAPAWPDLYQIASTERLDCRAPR